MSTLNTTTEIQLFRRTAFIGATLLLGITLMNLAFDTGTIDYPLPRLAIAIALLGMAIASYYSQYIREVSMYSLYAIFFIYNFYGIYLVAVNNFQPLDTSATIIIGFALGTFFRSRLHLNLYLSFLLITYVFFYLDCTHPNLNAEYFFTVLLFVLALGFTMFNGKIATMDNLTKSKIQLARSEERFRNIFEKSPVGIMLMDQAFKPFQLNNELERMLGYREEAFTNLDPHKYVHEEDYIAPHLLLAQLQRSRDKSYAIEQRFIRKDGEIIWVRETMALIQNDKDEQAYIVVMVEDITFQKKLNFTLKEYASNLETHNKALEDFSYVISHDLQEPLRMIRSYTSLIKRRYIEELNNKEAIIDLNYVIDGAERMSNLIRDMLAYSQMSAQSYALETVNTRDVLFEVLKNLTISIADNSAEVYCEEMPELPTNRMLFGQVMQNLIGNGIKYSHNERKPQIKISAEKRDFDVLFRVEDNGQGFDKKDENRIFGIFQRLHGRNSEYAGTGIGLAICKRIIEKQGGRIWAEGRKGEGATFYFTLPVKQAS